MLTRYRDPAPAPTTRPTIRFIRTAFLTVIALSIAACGSGGGDSSKPPAVGIVIVKVANSAGTPISGAGVSLNGSVTPSDPLTDANSEVEFKDTLAGEREASAARQGDVAPIRGEPWFSHQAESDHGPSTSTRRREMKPWPPDRHGDRRRHYWNRYCSRR